MFEIIPVYQHRYLHFHPVPPLATRLLQLVSCPPPLSQQTDGLRSICLCLGQDKPVDDSSMKEYRSKIISIPLNFDRIYIYILQLSDLNRYKS